MINSIESLINDKNHKKYQKRNRKSDETDERIIYCDNVESTLDNVSNGFQKDYKLKLSCFKHTVEF